MSYIGRIQTDDGVGFLGRRLYGHWEPLTQAMGYAADASYERRHSFHLRGRWSCRYDNYIGDCCRWRTAAQCCQGGDLKARPGWTIRTVRRTT